MNFSRPRFREYVMARLVTTAVFVFVLFSALLLFIAGERQSTLLAIVLLAVAFSVFIFIIYRGARRMQSELVTISKYLATLDDIDVIDYKTHFFTQEFEDINQNLMKVLKSAKKREDVKKRYSAKLKLKNRQRADMLSAIAHEFRNPIASIMGYAQTLQDDSDINQALREKFLGKIYNNGNKIESLLSRLILWNKFESKETTLYKSTFDMQVLVEEVRLSLLDKYSNRIITITGEGAQVEADRTLMDVLLKNLIENALKYSKDEVVIHLSEGKVSVTDRGVGISEKDREKVTKKFYRASTQSWDNSMGLGLSIVKSILMLHGSKLEIQSKEEEGSTFSFKI